MDSFWQYLAISLSIFKYHILGSDPDYVSSHHFIYTIYNTIYAGYFISPYNHLLAIWPHVVL